MSRNERREASGEKRAVSGDIRESRVEDLRWFGVVVFVVGLVWPMVGFSATATASEENPAIETPTVLELHNGDFVRGRLLGVEGKKLTWQSPFMVEPLKFTFARVSGIIVKPEQGKFERGEFAVELSNGRDQLFGDLKTIDEDSVTLESPGLGSLTLQRSHLRRIWRVDRVGESYTVPTSLRDWTRLKTENWTTRRGVITTETAGAALHADVNMPRQVQIEFELLYDAKDSAFAISFGTSGQEESRETAYSIETWGRQIVAQRRNKKLGDVIPLETMKSGSAQFVVYLDRDLGQMLVYSKQGQKLGEITVPDKVAGKSEVNAIGGGITIVNRKGKLQLKQLRMSGWSGTAPRSGGEATVTVAVDGEVHEVNDLRLEDGKLSLGEPVLDDGDETDTEPKEFDLEKLTRLDFRNENDSLGVAIVMCKDGTRLTGEVSSANEQELMFRVAASEDPIPVPLSGLKSLHIPKSSIGAPKHLPPYTHRSGTLELMDTRLSGWLVEPDEPAEAQIESAEAVSAEAVSAEAVSAEAEGDLPNEANEEGEGEKVATQDQADSGQEVEEESSCLVWQAAESDAPCRLRKDLYGRIVYSQMKPRAKQTARNANRVQRRNAINLAIFNGRANPNAANRTAYTSLKLAGAAIHLRSGDTIPCSIESINEAGVQIQSKLTETKHIPHKLIKAAQLNDTVAMPYLGEKKRERFLTLPRMQRDIPPQHLLFSKRGDILRGSIVSMSDRELDLELRLDSYRLPRSRVSAIVWLHQDELEKEKSAKSSDENEFGDDQPDSDEVDSGDVDTDENSKQESGDADKLQDNASGNVQVVGKNGGSRFTFYADSFSNQTIYGHSEVLQKVHAKVADIDQLLFGPFIDRAASSLPYHRWRLTSARDPKFVTEGDESSGESSPGTESALVGQPAPDIDLPSLDGDDFSLADHRGNCVVLDFWATWCGPCLQVMPQVEEVVAEFKEQDVRLFAVNLEETADQIRPTLERRKLNVNVVLDRDGVAATRYEATAIPQTVVVAPDGTIARVFVGSSRNFKEQLRAAIQEVVAAE